MMKIRLLALAVALVFAGSAALAHGNKVHVKGTVEKMGPDSLQVKTREGKTVLVKLVASTVYVLHRAAKSGDTPDTNEDKPAKVSDLAVGDAVVIHATPKEGNLEADEVKFSSQSPNKIASAAPKPKS